MNPPQVYMCSPSWTLLPPPSPFHPSGSSWRFFHLFVFFVCVFLLLFHQQRASVQIIRGFSGGSVVKNLTANTGDARDASWTSGLGGSPGRGNGNPLHYSCLENPMDRGVWWTTVQRVPKSWTWWKNLSVLIQMIERIWMIHQDPSTASVLYSFMGWW